MRVAIIGGGQEDAAHLRRIAVRRGLSVEFDERTKISVGENAARFGAETAGPQALLFEALARPDLAILALRAVREDPYFDDVGAVIVLDADSATQSEPPEGFDDFIIHPYPGEELDLRVRALIRRRREAGGNTTQVLPGFSVERASRNVSVDGHRVQLTEREFALFSYFAEWQGRVLSREHLLARVWGRQYAGGRRTVDIHVRRLRAKLGPHLPLETLRGSGYRLKLAGHGAENDTALSKVS